MFSFFLSLWLCCVPSTPMDIRQAGSLTKHVPRNSTHKNHENDRFLGDRLLEQEPANHPIVESEHVLQRLGWLERLKNGRHDFTQSDTHSRFFRPLNKLPNREHTQKISSTTFELNSSFRQQTSTTDEHQEHVESRSWCVHPTESS